MIAIGYVTRHADGNGFEGQGIRAWSTRTGIEIVPNRAKSAAEPADCGR
jgi:uncharacterized protein (DUF736 family)